ncbi:MAG TPA: response regulator [Polyangiaceae bacterium]|nr:response regulator [Polyangiaceae bacterium]
MKSCRCAQCNVSSARYAWGFALLARDGWAVSAGSEPLAALEGAWLCPACCARKRDAAPASAKPATAKAVVRQRSRPRGKLRVLLVDDEEMVRRCTARALWDFEVVCVGGGAEALQLLEIDGDFDAVLSDVMMPRMSGPELFAHCYERYPSLAQRFVFASGNPESARVELSRVVQRIGADTPPILLAKPSPREALLLALLAAAAHSNPQSGTFSLIEPAPLEVTKHRG